MGVGGDATACLTRIRLPIRVATVEVPITKNLPGPVAHVLTSLVDSVKIAFGTDLRSIVLFGSAAEGMLRPASDVNVLILLSAFDPRNAEKLREPLREAVAAIRLSAMFLLESELQPAMDAFPVKFGDIVRRHVVLCGSEPFAGKSVPREKAVACLKQTLLNLTLRMREAYVARGLREEQLAFLVSDMTGPLRACAATLLDLKGTPASSGKEALAKVAATLLKSPADSELMDRISQARQMRALPAGSACATFRSLIDLAHEMWAQANAL
jgi:predicted nucleotidyltransferase